MAFLSNDSDVQLDVVLTDLGRLRLAKGEFKVTKFACFDDEIDYTQYNPNHTSGSAYYDLSILQTPIFEAFTNDTSIGKHKLISIPRTNLLYLPVIRINTVFSPTTAMHSIGSFVVAVNKATEDLFLTLTGIIPGESGTGGTYIRLDQGLHTTAISPNFTIDADLIETQYMIEIDNRFGKIVSTNGTLARVSYINDDSIASYFLSLGTDDQVSENTERQTLPTQAIDGPRGTVLTFSIQSSIDLNSSDYLFDLIGSTVSMTNKNGSSTTVKYIDSYVSVMGATTGYSLNIPCRYINV